MPNSDITHGTAGIGLGQLRQWLTTGDDRFLARAVVAAEQVLRSPPSTSQTTTAVHLARPGGGADPPGRHRLLRLRPRQRRHRHLPLAVAAATGEPEFAAVATEALLTVLPQAVIVDGAAYWPASPDDAGDSSEAGYWPSWCNGSSGMGTAFLRAYLATGEPDLPAGGRGRRQGRAAGALAQLGRAVPRPGRRRRAPPRPG